MYLILFRRNPKAQTSKLKELWYCFHLQQFCLCSFGSDMGLILRIFLKAKKLLLDFCWILCISGCKRLNSRLRKAMCTIHKDILPLCNYKSRKQLYNSRFLLKTFCWKGKVQFVLATWKWAVWEDNRLPTISKHKF